MIEAELKAQVRDTAAVRARLDARAVAEDSIYHDTYYEPSPDFTATGRDCACASSPPPAQAKCC